MRHEPIHASTKVRVVALACLALLLVVFLVAPLHKDNPDNSAACLICHVTQRASVTPVAVDIGKPQTVGIVEILCGLTVSPRADAPDIVRSPRAPPVPFLSV